MVVRRKKKVTKYRGSKTHGGGSMKKRRGAGNRGGRGRAGSGKRGDAKKPRYWKEKPDKGFSSHLKRASTVNVGHINSMIVSLVRLGKASEKANVYSFDLRNIGVQKLLGGGVIQHKLILTVKHASVRAIEKVEAAGGTVTVQEDAPAESSSDAPAEGGALEE